MRIDSHQHFFDLDRLSYPWMPPAPSPLLQNYLPQNLKPVLDRNHFDGSIAVQATTQPEEADWLLSLAGENAFILGVVAWVDLTSPQLGHVLDHLQRHPKFKGVRHPVHDEPDDRWLLRSNVLTGLRELERRGIPYDLLLRPKHLGIIPELVELVPDLPMVIDHIAKPMIAQRVINGWAEDMGRIATIPHIYVKLSGMITEANPATWSADDLRPYIRLILNLFGPDRLMFGSDWPVCLLAGSWKEVLAAFTQALGAQSIEMREKLLGDNAYNFYRLSNSKPEKH